MALYRINRRNALFQGLPGDFVRAVPDPLMDAAVKSGIVSRWDVEESAPKKARKRKTEEPDGGSDGGEDTTGGDTEHTG